MSTQLVPMGRERSNHLRLVGGAEDGAPTVARAVRAATRRELKAMARVAAQLRRHARRLPEESGVRDELLETAEYYAATVEELADCA